MALTSVLHLVGGQIDHVVPLMESELDPTDKTVLLGVWHMVSVTLFIMAFWLIRYGLIPLSIQMDALRFIAWLNLLFAGVFIAVSLVQQVFAPQWILFLPMGLLVLNGLKGKAHASG